MFVKIQRVIVRIKPGAQQKGVIYPIIVHSDVSNINRKKISKDSSAEPIIGLVEHLF